MSLYARAAYYLAGIIVLTFMATSVYINAGGEPLIFKSVEGPAKIYHEFWRKWGVSGVALQAFGPTSWLGLSSAILAVFFALKVVPQIPPGVPPLVIAREWANTVYYLGFFGTLVSLMATILSHGAGESAQDITTTFSGAALALASTAAAIFIRTIWMIIAQSTLPHEISAHEAGPKIPGSDGDKATAEFLVELRVASNAAKDALETFSSGVQALDISSDAVTKAVSDGFKAAMKPTANAQATFAADIENTASKLNGLNGIFDETQEKLNSIDGTLKSIQASMAKSAENAASIADSAPAITPWRIFVCTCFAFIAIAIAWLIINSPV